MRLSCLQENLNRGLSIAARAVATRSTLPITSNILLTAEQSRLTLAATNLEIAISCWVGAKVEEEGSITIPARLLTDFVGSLPTGKIDIALSKNVLELKCARTEARISGMVSEDFPPIPQIADGVATQIEPDILKQGISRVAFVCASDESRPVLTGVHAKFEGSKLVLAAADGFRLAVQELPILKPVDEEIEVIIPGRALMELNRLLLDQEEPVGISIGKNQILFRPKNAEMVSQLLQGEFPRYQQLIPDSYGTRAVASTTETL
ncbi:MAG: DNA polymerase III subunit beta, partial [Dehalococcoidia bacterium]|nr:DNA polymerase III subunit beta [Dehalococcoidia bacterium]